METAKTFSKHIALHNLRQAKEKAAFEQIIGKVPDETSIAIVEESLLEKCRRLNRQRKARRIFAHESKETLDLIRRNEDVSELWRRLTERVAHWGANRRSRAHRSSQEMLEEIQANEALSAHLTKDSGKPLSLQIEPLSSIELPCVVNEASCLNDRCQEDECVKALTASYQPEMPTGTHVGARQDPCSYFKTGGGNEKEGNPMEEPAEPDFSSLVTYDQFCQMKVELTCKTDQEDSDGRVGPLHE